MLITLFAVLGLLFGSFGNVLVLRLPRGEGIGGRSHCPHCKRTLTAWELLPVVSFLMLRARCCGCKQPISWRYPIVELLSGALFVASVYAASFEIVPALFLAFSLWALLLIAIVDTETQTIPDALTLVLVVTGIGWSVMQGTLTLWAPLIGGGSLGLLWLLSRGKWMGSGDVFLSAAIGCLLGGLWEVVLCLLLAFILGGMVASLLLLTGYVERKSYLPFGPFLALAAVITLLVGEQWMFTLMPLMN